MINSQSLRRLLLAVLALAGLSAQSYGPADLDRDFSRTVVAISASSLQCYRFDIWVAEQRDQQTRGLMFVRDMPRDHGMLFVYPEPGMRSMWMKNTFLPLDMLFIREDGSVSSIATDTEPQSLRSVSAVEPVTYVLELNAGVTAELDIRPGDRIVF